MVVTYIHSNCPEEQIGVQLRCRNLADAINRTGTHGAHLLDINSFVRKTADAQEMCAESDVLVIYRYLYGPILNAIQYWKARDKKVIVDFDQAVNYMTEDKPGYSFWLKGKSCERPDSGVEDLVDPIPLEQFKWGLNMVDAATVSSGRLVDDWSQFTNVYEVPDHINLHHYPALTHSHEGEIWLGLGHNIDASTLQKSGLLEALENVCRARPQVKLVLCNLIKDGGPDMDVDPSRLKYYFPRCFEDWVGVLLNLDIGLVPICGNYDTRLGAGSLLEFMISKIPLIASQQLAFQPLAHYGQWVQNTVPAWEQAILNTVDQFAVYQKKAAGESFLFAIGQDASANIEKVLKVYHSIINHQ